jgi:5-methylcytosine-specific restriction endonuclease McrA
MKCRYCKRNFSTENLHVKHIKHLKQVIEIIGNDDTYSKNDVIDELKHQFHIICKHCGALNEVN